MPQSAGKAVFLSYASEDEVAARRIAEALRAAGVEVWLDQSELVGGDAWDKKIRHQIRDCALFMPVVSTATQARQEGYFRLEWHLAEQRSLLMAKGRPFIVPVTIDATNERGAVVPDSFAEVQWTRLPAGETSAAFCARMTSLLEGACAVGISGSGNSTREPALSAAASAGTAIANSSLDSRLPLLALPDKPSIAVLPFDNMSGDPEQEFFADNVVEAITATLSRIRSFFVIARNSAFLYKGRRVDVQQVGRELGVRYVLEGSVQKAGNRLRITVQLIDSANGAHVWADRVDGTLDDVFDLQDKITERVAGALQPSIRLAEIERARRKRPQELGAYDYAMRAMPLVWVLEKSASEEALALLEQALAIDPEYPFALALAGWCHSQRSVYNWTSDIASARKNALRLAERAAELGSDDPLILAVLGAVHCFLRNIGTARIMLERAVALDPNSAWAWSRLGWVENYSDRPERAIPHFERALRLSPLDPMNFNNYVGLGVAAELSGRFDDAVALSRRALLERPHAEWILRNLVSALGAAGRMDEAAVEVKRLMIAYPDFTVSKYREVLPFAAATQDRILASLIKAGVPE